MQTNRSSGVTVIAILSVLGSVLTFAMGILMLAVIAFLPASNLNQPPASPIPIKLILVISSLTYLLPAIWGIVTAIGLWRLRNWARISIIVFSVLLILLCGFSGLITVVVPFPAAPSSTVNPSVMLSIRLVMGVFWLALSGLGIWWLVFFNRSNVKKQFVQPPTMFEDGSLMQTDASLQDSIGRHGSGRPLSITILAWFLIAGCFFMPLNLVLRPPAIVFTKLLTGWEAVGFYLSFAAVQLCIGVGLLRLKPVARTAAIIYFAFLFVNAAVFYLAPGAHTRFTALMESQRSMFPWMRTFSNQAEFQFDITPFLFIGAVAGLVGITVPLYFLITRRVAFYNGAPELKSEASQT